MRKYPGIGLGIRLWTGFGIRQRIGVWLLGFLPLFSSSGFAGSVADLPELNLALKIVHFQEGSGSPVLDPQEAQHLIQEVNAFFTSCRVSFLLERLEPVIAAKLGLPEHPSTLEELDPIRARLQDPRRLLVIQTGAWRGTLAAANAWTVLPGEGPLGTVMESRYARHARLVAHELAHALDLDHVADRKNLLHPVLHPDSSALTPEQCAHLRTAAVHFHSLALRGMDSTEKSVRNLASAALQTQGELEDRNGIAARR